MDNTIVKLLIICTLDLVLLGSASDWKYSGKHGPDHWEDDCKEDSQSPIDINTKQVIPDQSLSALKFEKYEQNLTNGVFVNNGHSVQLNFPKNVGYTLSGGGMGDNTYTGLQLHFHWAAPSTTEGSEHTVNGMHYPVEMHIVHMKNPYTSIEDVKDMSDGLAVLGIFLQVEKGARPNPHYAKLFEPLSKIAYKDGRTVLHDGPSLLSLLPKSGSFYRYQGSLTTPPCYETVTWTVFQEPVIISQSQLEILQNTFSVKKEGDAKVKSDGCHGPDCHNKEKRDAAENEEEGGENSEESDEQYLGGNYRPTKPLNGRVVSLYLDKAITHEESDHWSYYGGDLDRTSWAHGYPTCDGSAQSPIDIKPDDSKSVSDSNTKPLQFQGYEKAVSGQFVNNGHAVQLNFDNDQQYKLADGGLDDTYEALQLHFHWGSVSSKGVVSTGSEHLLGGVQYPAEMHIVHAKSSYRSALSDYQSNSSDAYTVLGVFVQVAEDDENRDSGHNQNMQALIDAVHKVHFDGDSAEVPTGPSLGALLPKSKSFYRYSGSLTTPPCSESVVWTVFAEPILISLNQFIAFQQLYWVVKADYKEENSLARKKAEYHIKDHSTSETGGLAHNAGEVSDKNARLLSDDDFIRNNYRLEQDLNSRTVYYYDASLYDTTVSEPTPADESSVLKIVLFTLVGLIVFAIFIAIVMRCCCRKTPKKYTAGRMDDGMNL